MKRNCLFFMIVVMVLLAAAQPLLAQVPRSLRANIPFKFVAGNKMMPAGEYTVVPAHSEHFLALRSNGGDYLVVVAMPIRDAATPGSARLVFNKYGDRHFLALVWDGARTTALALPQSKREQETAKYHRPVNTIVLAQVQH